VPQSELEAAVATPGWFNHGEMILALVERHRPMVCVELGTWMGASAIPVARAIRRWGGHLTCVDTWAGDVYASLAVRQSAPWMLVSCARNLMDAGVGATVRLLPCTTAEAAVGWTESLDYLYIDAAHDEASVRADLVAWAPHVRPGGLILGDDYGHRLFPGVRRAWDTWEQTIGWPLTRYQSMPPDPDGIHLVYGVRPDETRARLSSR
jgi:predicted O-methyltransferase YrrM